MKINLLISLFLIIVVFLKSLMLKYFKNKRCLFSLREISFVKTGLKMSGFKTFISINYESFLNYLTVMMTR